MIAGEDNAGTQAAVEEEGGLVVDHQDGAPGEGRDEGDDGLLLLLVGDGPGEAIREGDIAGLDFPEGGAEGEDFDRLGGLDLGLAGADRLDLPDVAVEALGFAQVGTAGEAPEVL